MAYGDEVVSSDRLDYGRYQVKYVPRLTKVRKSKFRINTKLLCLFSHQVLKTTRPFNKRKVGRSNRVALRMLIVYSVFTQSIFTLRCQPLSSSTCRNVF